MESIKSIVFISNFLNHHQLSVALKLYQLYGDNYKFIATEPTPESFIVFGYEEMNTKFNFVIKAYESEEKFQRALILCFESDVAIIGAEDKIFIQKRLDYNKLTFRYNERIFKNGMIHSLSPRAIKNILNIHTKYNNKNLYMLCSSAYLAGELNLFGAYKNKLIKWGYFPSIIDYDIDYLINKHNNEKIILLWVGRFITWKHPESAIYVAKKLKKLGFNFILKMVGNGDLFNNIKEEIGHKKLNDCVELIGSVNYNIVREYMKEANIFMFTSDYNEGWGAVLNEAMNSGCAIVASHAIGSVPFLINHKKNGFIYKNRNNRELLNYVIELIQNYDLRKKYCINAYNDIKNIWSAENAVNNFIKLCNYILNNEKKCIIEGPCSKAETIMQKDMYNMIVRRKK
jgi:glycosyltransferase involved in cell wall biosynthesis